VVVGDGGCEAYTTIQRGVLLSHESQKIAEAEPVSNVEGNMCGTAMRGADALPRSKTTSRWKGSRRNLGDLIWPAVAKAIPGRDRKPRRQICRGTGEESDEPIVPLKRSNKAARSGGGERGGKGLSRREGRRCSTLRTLFRIRHAPSVARLRIGTVMGCPASNADHV
jgi:hypothetical protein